MKRHLIAKVALSIACWLAAMRAEGQSSPSSGQTPDQGADSTQSFVSPLGLGTGATLSVTSKGTSVAATVERQMFSPALNFWQAGLSGTTDKNGQAQLFSSSDKDAPGFKGKFGTGKSTFIRRWATYTETGGKFLRQAWCRDLLTVVNKSLKNPASIPVDAMCEAAVVAVKVAFDKSPPTDDKTKTLDTLVLNKLASADKTIAEPTNEAQMTPDQITAEETEAIKAQFEVCAGLKDQPSVFKLCPASGGTIKSPEDQRKTYPDLYRYILSGEPEKFQWKAWGSWAPTVTSVDYRAVIGGIPDLADKLQWTHLLNTGLGDIALYYGKAAFGIEGGFGQTVKVTTQNVCNTTTSGTYTSQSCDMAMIGKPNPKNAWMASSALQFYPIPVLGNGTLFNPGLQVNSSYVAPTTGGHSSELAFPFYVAPSASPIKFVVGIQPTWDWNTDPKIGNKFTISLFVGARPEITK
jgi:hypothetical protein